MSPTAIKQITLPNGEVVPVVSAEFAKETPETERLRLSARFTGSRADHRSRGQSSGSDHQRQGVPGRGRWERVGHIGTLPGRYTQSRLSPGIYRRVCYRGHRGQLRRSPGNGDELCGGRVTFKVQFQSANLTL